MERERLWSAALGRVSRRMARNEEWLKEEKEKRDLSPTFVMKEV